MKQWEIRRKGFESKDNKRNTQAEKKERKRKKSEKTKNKKTDKERKKFPITLIIDYFILTKKKYGKDISEMLFGFSEINK